MEKRTAGALQAGATMLIVLGHWDYIGTLGLARQIWDY